VGHFRRANPGHFSRVPKSGVDVDFVDDPYRQLNADDGEQFTTTEVHITSGRPNKCQRQLILSGSRA